MCPGVIRRATRAVLAVANGGRASSLVGWAYRDPMGNLIRRPARGAGEEGTSPAPRRALLVCGPRLFAVWFPYRRWPLVVILHLPSAIAFRAAFLVIAPPPPA